MFGTMPPCIVVSLEATCDRRGHAQENSLQMSCIAAVDCLAIIGSLLCSYSCAGINGLSRIVGSSCVERRVATAESRAGLWLVRPAVLTTASICATLTDGLLPDGTEPLDLRRAV